MLYFKTVNKCLSIFLLVTLVLMYSSSILSFAERADPRGNAFQQRNAAQQGNIAQQGNVAQGMQQQQQQQQQQQIQSNPLLRRATNEEKEILNNAIPAGTTPPANGQLITDDKLVYFDNPKHYFVADPSQIEWPDAAYAEGEARPDDKELSKGKDVDITYPDQMKWVCNNGMVVASFFNIIFDQLITSQTSTFDKAKKINVVNGVVAGENEDSKVKVAARLYNFERNFNFEKFVALINGIAKTIDEISDAIGSDEQRLSGEENNLPDNTDKGVTLASIGGSNPDTPEVIETDTPQNDATSTAIALPDNKAPVEDSSNALMYGLMGMLAAVFAGILGYLLKMFKFN